MPRIIDTAPTYDYGSEVINDAYGPRRAWVYSPSADTVYVGGPGMHHSEVQDHYGLGWEPKRALGIYATGRSGGMGAVPGPGIYSVGLGHEEHPHVYQQLAEHYGVPNMTHEGEPRFGAGTQNRLDWDEGNYGKGLVDSHGTVYTFNEEDYQLHSDYIGANLAHRLEFLAYFVIDPNGRITSADVKPLDPQTAQIITDADPRLHYRADQYSFDEPQPMNFG